MKRAISIPTTLATVLLLILLLVASPVNAAANDARTQITGTWWSLESRQPSTYPANKQIYQSRNTSLQSKLIVVDPGHGGSDTGAIGPNHVMEKNITLAIAQELRNLLTADGATVIMTRAADQDVAYSGASDKEELAARIGIANQAKADLFISIHADAFDGSAGGTTTYFYDATESDDELARVVQNNMVAKLQLYDRGVQQNDYLVLEMANMPAVLVEAAFISNPKEAKLLANRSFDKKVAAGLYNGISQYFLTQ
ncbi:N-acetylmuramoyl-L-alanine amidase [Sporomusa sp.]|uniref:N-acetylmuramoyl-L-alanine amidase family protein n=1 Tax=Sporomusa sp. TaxID=2078658 RepID=UPI002CDBE33A|nr:N-acetylmuramoyl-L-alanine amidase [Sporomusa sp.]HWR44177.1 N-acetylmuramoyl-L-alanine amidase [Sporomusa sp.]